MPIDLGDSSRALRVISRHARRLGFTLVGVAPVGPMPAWPAYARWLERGYAGEMGYLAARRDDRRDVRSVWPEARSVVALGVDYRVAAASLDVQPPNTGVVASYAWGTDYHEWCRRALAELLRSIRAEFGSDTDGRGYVDTGPILERHVAEQAGLGWVGKNTMLISQERGSWFFLTELLLNVDLPPSEARIADRCGTCTRCIDACPTQAIVQPYVLDARRCISYLTIENKGRIPRDLRPLMGPHIFGCDVCQDVCPWNCKAPTIGDGPFAPRDGPFARRDDLIAPDLLALLRLTPGQFKARCAGSPILRAKRRGLLRSVAVALGNVGDCRAVEPLADALADREPLVREHAGWALMRLAGQGAVGSLTAAIEGETDDGTREDLRLSLHEAQACGG